MKRLTKTIFCLCAAAGLTFVALPFSGCAKDDGDQVVLRVSSWEEYIDLGGWDEEERIEIDNPFLPEGSEETGIIGVNEMVDDFEEWFYDVYGYKVSVEYSTFGTNEDLNNRMNLGDVYDLVCPSDYLIMQLIRENKVMPYSIEFFDEKIDTNYYAQYASTYIKGVFENNSVKVDETQETLKWSECAACYMWGTTGIVYNEDAIIEIGSLDDVSSWKILTNENYKRRVTIKDNVRDSYFTALGIANLSDLSAEELAQVDRDEILNAKDEESIAKAEDVLKKIKDNVYSFETDSGKADMITGKVAANLQWSGDAVYIMDQAESDKANPTELWFSVPEECTNLWFDGWVMLKEGIGEDEKKQEAAEAFVNFLSRPDNAIRNMYYIGYTSAIAGDTVLDYLKYNYEAEEDAYIYEYDLSYFFGDGAVIEADALTFDAFDEHGNPNRGRQLFAQYPPLNVIERSVVMRDFEDALPSINQMWINVRCLDVKDFDPAVVWTVLGIAIAGGAAITLYKLRYKIFIRREKTA